MLRCRIWNERSSAYVCAFCRHPALPRQRDLSRRNYSNSTKPPSKDDNGFGSWSSSNGSVSSGIPRRSPGPVNGSGWGAPAFGQGNTSRAPSYDDQEAPAGQGKELDDGLLPHERAARQKLADQKAVEENAAQEAAEAIRKAQEAIAQRNIRQRGPGGGPGGGSQNVFRSVTPRGLGSGIGSAGEEKEKKPKRFGSGLGDGPKNDLGANTGTNVNTRTLGGLDEKPLRSIPRFDWRHRHDSDGAPASTPVPHYRRAEKDGFNGLKPLKASRQQWDGLGKSDALGSGSWNQLSKKRPNDTTNVSDRNAPLDSTLSRESFFSKFQERVGSNYKLDDRNPRASRSELGGLDEGNPGRKEQAVENVSQKFERKAREFDETYEISRDSRRRDKTGNRRGDGYGSSRGAYKSRAQQQWEDDNEEWEDGGASVAERRRRKAEERARRAAEAEAAASVPSIFLPEFISISNLGTALKMKIPQFLRALIEMGFEDITEDSIMTGETAALVAQEFGFDPKVDTGGARDLKARPIPEDVSILPQRPPVVTIMGHVDHGKTTLLDYLRQSSVAAQEHGGITQHIGAFMVKMSEGKLITFLDTPGHAAFLTMRQRGANVTDIVVLVVAADDSVKPQTLEALKHARSAKVPLIVAINKCDKEDARPDQVKADLARHGVEIEDFGGDVQVVCVSGKTGQGMAELEENIVTLAEIQDMRAEDDGMAEAWVLEASVKPYGKSANVLVKRGTLRLGDFIVAGTAWARVRILRNEAGQELDEAPPGTPVEVLGWRDELPAAGDEIIQAPDEDRARVAVDYREEMREREASSKQLAEQELREREAKIAAEVAADIEAADADAEPTPATAVVNFMVRGDVVGSVEAVCATINEIGNNEVKPRILRSAAGQVSESDVEHAEASGSVIANFSSTIPGHIKAMAEEKGVRILDHSVIYHLADDVKQVMSEALPDKVSSKVVGEAEILQIFPINIKGRVYKNIAGCKVRNGTVTRSTRARILRGGEKVFDGKIDTLKHGKKDVNEIRKGSECGIALDGFTDFHVGDQIQMYEEVREKRTL
ncbi:translation initiation factor IF-2 [Colletotrichum orchidophilum]|uniref:Translation initiation factor IF-2, mitochondrial n=1 Tax=Colletotrichum orchidophilum TaxID=1209926 RepID=A0A1G4BSN5_9PEZI|nr:translation initiation factor IF-2 [Colletotrichum orchidophilum]OHF04398.1 translation initiation factor IF-2 [Colletotrichum orchidophilum]